MTDVALNLSEIHEGIDRAARKSGRRAEDIRLVCVSKTFSADRVRLAYDEGERDFGENRVQEYLEKKKNMPENCNWHIIGRLQTNKVKFIINNVYLLHSLDRMNLAEELQKELAKAGMTMDVLLQVNTAGEETKAGFSPEEFPYMAEKIAGMENIRVKGIMTVAPFTDDREYLKGVFVRTKQLFDNLKKENYSNFDCRWLSMGMSGDYDIAIGAGANMVRIGSAVFGSRIYK